MVQVDGFYFRLRKSNMRSLVSDHYFVFVSCQHFCIPFTGKNCRRYGQSFMIYVPRKRLVTIKGIVTSGTVLKQRVKCCTRNLSEPSPFLSL
jgi:hypothetical protein